MCIDCSSDEKMLNVNSYVSEFISLNNENFFLEIEGEEQNYVAAYYDKDSLEDRGLLVCKNDHIVYVNSTEFIESLFFCS